MFIIGAVANLAGLVTFIDWAAVKSKAKKQKKPLDRSLKALGKLELSLEEISNALKEKKNLSEVQHYVNLLYEAKADLVENLRDMGAEIPQEEEAPILRGASNEALLTIVNLCENNVSKARSKLGKP